jgi:MYXO-CTERM domain-containing protein
MRLLGMSVFIVCAVGAHRSARAVDYYVSPAGADDRNGTAPDRAWRTLTRVNALDLEPGDRVLFEGGHSFDGPLELGPEDAGSPDAPVVIGSYGTGRATLRGGNGTALSVYNAGGIRIENLVVVGSGRTVNKGSGVHVVNTLSGNRRLSYIRIDNVKASGFGRNGIFVGGQAVDGSKSGFEDVRITRCEANDNQYYGVRVSGRWQDKPTRYANRDVYIGHCRAYDNAGDPNYLENHSGSGIFLEDVDGGVIEHSIAYNNGFLCNARVGGPVGIWAAVANNVVIQYCESYRNRTGRGADGGGFDLDGGVTNSVMQYNYSHDNDGAGYLLYTYRGSPWSFRNNVLRYSISENDGQKNAYGGIWVVNDGSGVSDIDIYNNTIYVSPAKRGGSPRGLHIHRTTRVRFLNNILVAAGGVPLVDGASGQAGLVMQGNDYYAAGGAFNIRWGGTTYRTFREWRAASGQEKLPDGTLIGWSVDPQMTSSGGGIIIGDTSQLGALTAYRLRASSPLIDAGLDLRARFKIDPGQRDFFGNPLPDNGRFDVGAHEVVSTLPDGGPGVDSASPSPEAGPDGTPEQGRPDLIFDSGAAAAPDASPGTEAGADRPAVSPSASDARLIPDKPAVSGGATTGSGCSCSLRPGQRPGPTLLLAFAAVWALRRRSMR